MAINPRLDFYPTHEICGFKVRVGKPCPLGTTFMAGGINFSVFSRHATSCSLVLFCKGDKKPYAELPFPPEFRTGDIFHMLVFNLDFESLEYGYRFDGPHDPKGGHRFDPGRILLDPYAKIICGREVWGEPPEWDDYHQHLSRIALDDFDWEKDKALEIPLEDLIIYEMHVRSFTRHPSSKADDPGTFAGMREKIPYLKELGINCVELMPIYEFDEFENYPKHTVKGAQLMNYWGYSPVGIFAPKAGYAATAPFGNQMDELKHLVKDLHRNGIEAILDMVFNHTAEGNESGPVISFKGIDNKTYYMMTPDGRYCNFSGCGNTLNSNDPVVRHLILDALRHWADEYHVDGFRFDLASLLGRDPAGASIPNPSLMETLAHDPVLSKCKLLVETWDKGGIQYFGSQPALCRCTEWNERYRDDIRKFLKSDPNMVGAVAQRIQGSPDIYGSSGRGPTASVNYITCHDGFTLCDLVSYNQKHNEANGENNRDGVNENNSWNCGAEGETANRQVVSLRLRQMKNALAILLLSHGVPMILSGDEMARTQLGNNNNYCHDNELSWLDWRLLKKNDELFRFVKMMIRFRRAHAVLRSRSYMTHQDHVGSGRTDITWHGIKAGNADWSGHSRVLAFMLDGRHAKGGAEKDNSIYAAINMHWEPLTLELPPPPSGERWHIFAHTSTPHPDDVCEPGNESQLAYQKEISLGSRSVAVLVSKPK